MRMDKLTNPLQSALADAQSLAVGRDHNFIEPQHILMAMLEQQGASAKPLLSKAGVDVTALLAAVLPNPMRMRVDDPSPYVRERARWIQRQMRALGGTGYVRTI